MSILIPTSRIVRFLLLVAGLVDPLGSAQAASCCSASGLQLGWLSSEDQGQFTLRNSYVSVIGDVAEGTRPIFYRSTHTEQEWVLSFEGSRLLTDRVQMTGRFPIHLRSAVTELGGASHFGIMDPTFGMAYEILPSWSYHPWMPEGWLTFSWSVPLAGSPWNSSRSYLVDAVGKGQHWVGLGGLFTRNFRKWVATAQLTGRFGIPNAISGTTGRQVLGWGTGFESLFRVGYQVSPETNFGLAFAPSWETVRPDSAEVRTKIAFPLLFQVAYDLTDDWTLSGIYSDSTLLPGGSNIQFERVFTLTLTRFWAR